MDKSQLTAIVLDVIRSRLLQASSEITLNTPLGPGGLALDSIDLLEIIIELEDRTNITIRDESLTGETLTSPNTLIDYLIQVQNS